MVSEGGRHQLSRTLSRVRCPSAISERLPRRPYGFHLRFGLGVRVAVGVRVGVGVTVRVAVGLGVAVRVGVGLLVGLGTAVGVCVGVGLAVGLGVTVGATALSALSLPWLQYVPVPAIRSAVDSILLMTCEFLQSGFWATTRAANPETNGADVDVP
jgi:hypothetical protein